MSTVSMSTVQQLISEHELEGRTLSLLQGDTVVSATTVEISHVLDLSSRVLLCPVDPTLVRRPLVLRNDDRVEYFADPARLVVTGRLAFGEERWLITA